MHGGIRYRAAITISETSLTSVTVDGESAGGRDPGPDFWRGDRERCRPARRSNGEGNPELQPAGDHLCQGSADARQLRRPVHPRRELRRRPGSQESSQPHFMAFPFSRAGLPNRWQPARDQNPATAAWLRTAVSRLAHAHPHPRRGRLRQDRKKPDQVVDVRVQRDAEVLAADVDGVPIHFGRKGRLLELLLDRARLHLAIPDRV